MYQNPLNHKLVRMVWVWVLVGALILGAGCSKGSDNEVGNSTQTVKQVEDQAETSQPETHHASVTAQESEAEATQPPQPVVPMIQPASATSQEALAAIDERFKDHEGLLFLHSARPENEYVVVGFPGRLLVEPDTLSLEKVLANQPPRVTVKVDPDAIASILVDEDHPSAAIMGSNNIMVGLVATEKAMLQLRRSAVVTVPQSTENQADNKAAKAILASPASEKGAPSAEHQSTAEESSDASDAADPHGEAPEADSHEAAADNTEDATHKPVAMATTQHQDAQTHPKDVGAHATANAAPPKKTDDHHGAPAHTFDDNLPTGVALVDSAIKPMTYELKERFWGWRPNDLVRITDNVNHFQLGVLEVTRRTAVILAQRISRTGITAAFDPNLEQAMNWFMIKADRFWLPSAESKYRDGLSEWKEYRERLIRGEASFFNRADNLIPLLTAYEDLLGSCEENLVKATEDDGSHVSYFSSDNYFFYAQGVINALVTILEAVGHDFEGILTSRRADEDLHHAISSCEHALEINPILILNNASSSIFANHRANLAAPVSHARFFLGVLIKTLST